MQKSFFDLTFGLLTPCSIFILNQFNVAYQWCYFFAAIFKSYKRIKIFVLPETAIFQLNLNCLWFFLVENKNCIKSARASERFYLEPRWSGCVRRASFPALGGSNAYIPCFFFSSAYNKLCVVVWLALALAQGRKYKCWWWCFPFAGAVYERGAAARVVRGWRLQRRLLRPRRVRPARAAGRHRDPHRHAQGAPAASPAGQGRGLPLDPRFLHLAARILAKLRVPQNGQSRVAHPHGRPRHRKQGEFAF